MSIFDDAPGGATGVATEVAGAESASPVSPSNEPGATGQPAADPTSIVPEGQGSGVADPTGAPAAIAAVAPPALTEEQLTQMQSQLPANAAQAFARFRTENSSLTEEVTRLRTENEGLQTPPGGAIIIDAPVDEWNPAAQLEKMPEGHYLKLAHLLTDFHLPDRIGNVLEKYDELPPESQKAIANAFSAQMEREIGLTTAQIFEACEKYKGGVGAQPANATAQGSQPRASFAQKLIDDHMFSPTDPLVLGLREQEREFGSLRGEMDGLKKQFAGQQTTYTQSQAHRAEEEARSREQEFQSKKSAVQTSVLDPIKKGIPAGYEQSYAHVEAAALRAIDQDPTASNHLATAKACLARAAKFTAEGSGDFATREMTRYAGEMAKYAALFALKAQAEAKYQTGLVAENVSLKSRAPNGQVQRREVIGASATAVGENGRPQREPNETADGFGARVRNYLIGKLESSRPEGTPSPTGR